MFDFSKELMRKIKNKEDMDKRDLIILEGCLRLYDVYQTIQNYQIGITNENDYELEESI